MLGEYKKPDTRAPCEWHGLEIAKVDQDWADDVIHQCCVKIGPKNGMECIDERISVLPFIYSVGLLRLDIISRTRTQKGFKLRTNTEL